MSRALLIAAAGLGLVVAAIWANEGGHAALVTGAILAAIAAAALGGAPGVRSARFAGDHATDEENLRRLLDEALYEVCLQTGIGSEVSGDIECDGGKIEAGCYGAPAHEAECVATVVALEVENLLACDVTNLGVFDPVQCILSSAKTIEPVVAGDVTRVDGGAFVPTSSVYLDWIGHCLFVSYGGRSKWTEISNRVLAGLKENDAGCGAGRDDLAGLDADAADPKVLDGPIQNDQWIAEHVGAGTFGFDDTVHAQSYDMCDQIERAPIRFGLAENEAGIYRAVGDGGRCATKQQVLETRANQFDGRHDGIYGVKN